MAFSWGYIEASGASVLIKPGVEIEPGRRMWNHVQRDEVIAEIQANTLPGYAGPNGEWFCSLAAVLERLTG